MAIGSSSTRAVGGPTEGRAVVAAWLADFAEAVALRNGIAAAQLFRADGYWRDILALTWDLRTFAGRSRIGSGLQDALAARRVSNVQLEDADPEVFERKTWGWTIEAFFRFETDIATGRGHVRLLRDPADGGWRAWTVLTAMEDLIGFEERARHHRAVARPGHGTGGAVTTDGHAGPLGEGDPAVLVIGSGQAGLTVAARLQQLDVRTLVVERHPRVGDNWRRRYQSLFLHNQVWANHLPYLPFPSSWPVYLSKDELADWLEAYAGVMGLQLATGTEVVSGDWDEASRRWNVRLRSSSGSARTVHPRHVVLATGVFGGARTISLPGRDRFNGAVMLATEYDGQVDVKGSRALVVGSGSSAHDVAQDLHQRGAATTTMLQRSSTCVVSVEPGAARAYSIYSEDGAPVEDCDLVNNAFPLPLLAELHKDLSQRIAEMDDDLLRGLRDAGFALDFGEDGSGFLMKYHRYGGGYYINVGCSDLIVSGDIKVKQGCEIERLEGRTVHLSDGTTTEADLLVVAAGYRNMSDTVRTMFGDAVADRVGPVWGLDEEGEVRAMWRRTGQPGFWITGGSLQQCRPYSKYLGLQIKGMEESLL